MFINISKILFVYCINTYIITTSWRTHVRDTDSNKSSDFLLNSVCIMLIYIITVLLCKYCNPRARLANVQDVKAKCINVVRGSHVCGFAWCWTEAVSRE